MAVLQMQRMSICALKKDRKAILEKLQHMGVMEINQMCIRDRARSPKCGECFLQKYCKEYKIRSN